MANNRNGSSVEIWRRLSAPLTLAISHCTWVKSFQQPLVVTFSDANYASFLPSWSAHIERFGGDMRAVVAMDVETEVHAQNIAGICVIPFKAAVLDSRLAPRSSLHATANTSTQVVRKDTGARAGASVDAVDISDLAKFSVMGVLLEAGFDVTLSEMDVLWFRKPSFAFAQEPLLGLDNYPASNGMLNIGFMHVRSLETTSGFFRQVTKAWAAAMLKLLDRGVGHQLPRGQIYFNRFLHSAQRNTTPFRWALLNRSIFACSRVLQAYGHGRMRVAQPTGEALRLVQMGFPHRHLEDTLAVFHAISLTVSAKKALLTKLYSGHADVHRFATAPWEQLVDA